MKPSIIAEIERIAGDRLTPEMREEITDRAIKIIADHNRMAAIVAIETVKEVMVKASNNAESTESRNPKPA